MFRRTGIGDITAHITKHKIEIIQNGIKLFNLCYIIAYAHNNNGTIYTYNNNNINNGIIQLKSL